MFSHLLSLQMATSKAHQTPSRFQYPRNRLYHQTSDTAKSKMQTSKICGRKMAQRMYANCLRPSLIIPICFSDSNHTRRFCVHSSSGGGGVVDVNSSHRLVLEVKEKLARSYSNLPTGKCGRDDEDMILWFLKDREFSVGDAVKKLSKAIKWRQDFGVSALTEDLVKNVAKTGKSYVHEFLDVNGRPVLLVATSKHISGMYAPIDDQRLCVFMIEKALSKLPPGQEQILAIVDLRGFGVENADVKFLTFLFDVFYYYYPKRLSEVLFVDAPFVFQPIWQLAKPLLKSYVSLVRFCSVEAVRKEYFTEATLPAIFKD